MGFATRPGQISAMYDSRGSTFIQTLGIILEQNYEKMHLEGMFTLVTDIVAREFHQVKCDTNKAKDFMQIPEKISTLRVRLYFTSDPHIRVCALSVSIPQCKMNFY